MRVLGVLLIVVGFILVFAWIFGPAISKDLIPLYEQVYCRDGEEFVTRTGPSSDGGTNYTFHCNGDDRRTRDVTAIMILSGTGAGLGLLFIGVMMVVSGYRRRMPWIVDLTQTLRTGKTTANWVQTDDNVIKVAGVEIRMDGTTAAASGMFQLHEDLSFTESLKQLDEARDAGLVTLVEYDRLRRKILSRFEDRTDGK